MRKNFQSVPFYAPAIAIGPDGVATVRVKLPDDLTNFKVRAKAIGPTAPSPIGVGGTKEWRRFGFGTGRIEVRQPVVVQPSLPRFVRPGDRFTATAVGRIVEGDAGPGRAQIRVEGLELQGEASQPLEWVANRASRLDFPVSVPTPAYRDDGSLARTEVVVRMGAERLADKAGDAVEVRLPIRDDRDRVTLRRAGSNSRPASRGRCRRPAKRRAQGSLRRKLLVSTEPALVTMAAGFDFLLAYPYGCTEQRLSTTRAQIALRRFRTLLHQEGDDKSLDRAVADTLAWLPAVQNDSGLLAYWPGGSPSVSLTAWTVEFLAEAQEAGFTLDDSATGAQSKAIRALEQALRSDSTNFVDGESWGERTWALRALARAGKFDPAYGNELARRAQFLDLENSANVLLAFDRAGQDDRRSAAAARSRTLEGLRDPPSPGSRDLRRPAGPRALAQRTHPAQRSANRRRDDARSFESRRFSRGAEEARAPHRRRSSAWDAATAGGRPTPTRALCWRSPSGSNAVASPPPAPSPRSRSPRRTAPGR